MAITTFDGPVRSLNGFYSQGPGNILTLGASVTLSPTTHGGHTLLLPATTAIVLPTIVATADAVGTGPGADPNTLSNLGVTFNLFFDVINATSSSITITCGGSDVYIGQLTVMGTTTMAFASITNAIIQPNKTTSGGAARGSMITLTAIKSGVWAVSGVLLGSGTVITPFV
tara:strand:- start:512 stop:1024 length:513 start_codon:yes stop_codon:yes gene_type:complete